MMGAGQNKLELVAQAQINVWIETGSNKLRNSVICNHCIVLIFSLSLQLNQSSIFYVLEKRRKLGMMYSIVSDPQIVFNNAIFGGRLWRSITETISFRRDEGFPHTSTNRSRSMLVQRPPPFRRDSWMRRPHIPERFGFRVAAQSLSDEQRKGRYGTWVDYFLTL
jgi:hypothetical protein